MMPIDKELNGRCEIVNPVSLHSIRKINNLQQFCIDDIWYTASLAVLHVSSFCLSLSLQKAKVENQGHTERKRDTYISLSLMNENK